MSKQHHTFHVLTAIVKRSLSRSYFGDPAKKIDMRCHKV